MDVDSIREAISRGQFSSEELDLLKGALNHKIEEVERSEKVRIFSFRHSDCTQYFRNVQELRVELIGEIEGCDDEELVGSTFEVGDRHVPESDVSGYIKTLFV